MPVELERPKFLVDLLAEVDSFDETLFLPNFKIEEGERVIGTVNSPWIRKAYALGRFYQKQCKLLVLDQEYRSVEDVMADEQIVEMKYKSDLIAEAMWVACRAEFRLFAEENIGLRQEWTLVAHKSKEPQGLAAFLNFLRGQKE